MAATSSTPSPPTRRSSTAAPSSGAAIAAKGSCGGPVSSYVSLTRPGATPKATRTGSALSCPWPWATVLVNSSSTRRTSFRRTSRSSPAATPTSATKTDTSVRAAIRAGKTLTSSLSCATAPSGSGAVPAEDEDGEVVGGLDAGGEPRHVAANRLAHLRGRLRPAPGEQAFEPRPPVELAGRVGGLDHPVGDQAQRLARVEPHGRRAVRERVDDAERRPVALGEAGPGAPARRHEI